MSASRRVVVSGVGMVTSIATGRRRFWEQLLAGRSGISPVESFDTGRYAVHRGGEVRGFDPAAHCRRLDPADIGRATAFAVAATRLALEDADLSADRVTPASTAVVMGTTSGEPAMVERFVDRELGGAPDLGPDLATRYPCHLIAARIAEEFELAGPNLVIPTACAAGNYAVAHAFDLIRGGDADLAVAGGADAFSRITYTGFARLGAIAPDRCQPFDRHRKGTIPGEGAAALVLEPLERATARGARIYAEVVGYGLSCDAFHMTAPQGDGAVRAMRAALERSGLTPDDVSYVSAHGTGTSVNDRVECAALKTVFGERLPQVPVSSIKSMLGHTMGAASAIEAAACALAVAFDRIPPTINYEDPDPECDLDCVPNQAREREVVVAMNNAYAFGGNNASVLFRKPTR